MGVLVFALIFFIVIFGGYAAFTKLLGFEDDL